MLRFLWLVFTQNPRAQMNNKRRIMPKLINERLVCLIDLNNSPLRSLANLQNQSPLPISNIFLLFLIKGTKNPFNFPLN